MKRWIALFAAVLAAGMLHAQETNNAEPSAQDLLDDVILRLPREPLAIAGDMVLRKRHGIVLKEAKFEMSLKWGNEPAEATYSIQDTFGRELERLTVTRPRDEAPVFHYFTNAPPQEAKVPDLSQSVQGTDLSWMDLTLSFLWWKDGKMGKGQEIRGRECYVVEVPAPAGNLQTQYASVRVWIDAKYRMLLQAEGLDAGGKRVRILWIKSIKKINDRYMIKDLEVQASSEHRTKLIVREVNGEKTGMPAEADSPIIDDSASGTITPTPVEPAE